MSDDCPARTREPIACGCGEKCLRPTAEEYEAAHKRDMNLVVMGGKVWVFQAGTSSSWSPGYERHETHHFDGRKTKVVTVLNGRRRVTYEHNDFSRAAAKASEIP